MTYEMGSKINKNYVVLLYNSKAAIGYFEMAA